MITERRCVSFHLAIVSYTLNKKFHMYARLCIIFYLFYMPVCLFVFTSSLTSSTKSVKPAHSELCCNKMYFSTKTGKRTLYRTCQFTTRSSYGQFSFSWTGNAKKKTKLRKSGIFLGESLAALSYFTIIRTPTNVREISLLITCNN